MNHKENPYAVMLLETVRVPFRDRESTRCVLLGGLLSLLPVVNFVAWGFLYRIFIQGLNGAAVLVLPSWHEWRRYIRVGAWLFLIMAIYVVLLSFGVLAIASAGGASMDDPAHVTAAVFAALGLFHTFSAVALARFAAAGRVWAAFEPDALWRDLRLVFRPDYIQLLSAAYGVWLMAQVLFAPSPILIPIASVIQFYVMTVMAHVLGRLVGDRLAVVEEDVDENNGDASE